MASNNNAPHGFAPIGTMHGGAQRIEEFAKVATNAAIIYKQDIVTRLTGSTTNSEGRIVGLIDAAVSFTPGTTLITGVVLNTSLASTATDHQVFTDPEMIYEAQSTNGTSNGAGGAGINAADPGKNINANVATAGTVYGTAAGRQGLSGMMIDPTTIATTSTLDFHMLGLYQEFEATGGNAFGAYARIIVLANKHRMANAVAGV